MWKSNATGFWPARTLVMRKKYLGLRAPLTDKTVWTLKDARTSLADTETALLQAR